MIHYAFPQLILDACTLAVAPVLREVLSQLMGEEMSQDEAAHYMASLLKGDPDAGELVIGAGANGPDLSSLDYRALIYLIYHQPYTGFPFEPLEAAHGAMALINRHYDVTEEQWQQLWMTQHIYETARLDLDVPDAVKWTESAESGERSSFSTWTDERAMDIMKGALLAFGEDVDRFFAPFTTVLEARTDMRRADEGDADAMVEVAYDLIEGRGVERDTHQAIRWAENALAHETKRRDEAEKMVAFLTYFNARENN